MADILQDVIKYLESKEEIGILRVFHMSTVNGTLGLYLSLFGVSLRMFNDVLKKELEAMGRVENIFVQDDALNLTSRRCPRFHHARVATEQDQAHGEHQRTLI